MPSREKRAAHGHGADNAEADMLNGVSAPGSKKGEGAFRPTIRALGRRSSEARQRFDAFSETLLRQTREHPGRSVALALGAGYVLGGGLFTVLTARLLGAAVRIGVRVAVVPMVTDSIAALGGGLMGEGGGADGEDEPSAETAH